MARIYNLQKRFGHIYHIHYDDIFNQFVFYIFVIIWEYCQSLHLVTVSIAFLISISSHYAYDMDRAIGMQTIMGLRLINFTGDLALGGIAVFSVL